jgi:hypothetical protein
MVKTSFAIAATTAGLVLARPALAQTEDQKLGSVHFATSCNAEAQKLFDRAANTQRERDYIDALAVMYADYDSHAHCRLRQGDGRTGAGLSR